MIELTEKFLKRWRNAFYLDHEGGGRGEIYDRDGSVKGEVHLVQCYAEVFWSHGYERIEIESEL